MASAPADLILGHIRKLVAAERDDQQPDRLLLERFAGQRDEAAFTALVRRHGSMVWRVCRRVLHDWHDAEDVFQATFLTLARKAASIRKQESLSCWLHGVAYRLSLQVHADARKRRNRLGSTANVSPADPADDLTWRELRSVLDEELNRLPEKYRAPLLLCYLEGQTRDEAAQQLKCPLGTLKSRLERGRELLRTRLTRRGLTLSVGLLATGLSQSTSSALPPSELAQTTIRTALLLMSDKAAAAGVISTQVANLVKGGIKAMALTKLKTTMVVLLAISIVVAGAGVLTHQLLPTGQASQPIPGSSQPDKPQPAGSKKEAEETFVYKGRVLDPDGKPFAGANLYLAVPEEIAKTRPVRAKTKTDGRFEFTVSRAELALPPEVPADVDVFSFLQVVAVAKGYGPDWTLMQEGKRPTGELTLRLVKNDVTINGRILDLQARPVAGAKVHVLRLETTPEDDLAPFFKTWKSERSTYVPVNLLTKVWFDPALVDLPKTVTTDAHGRFRLPGAGNERILLLSVEAPLIEHATIRVLPRSAAEVKALVRVPSEKMMRMGELPPSAIYGSTFEHLGIPARTVVGAVHDKETGKPMAGVRVSGHAMDRMGETNVETYTDKKGRYQLQGLAKANKYQLYAWPGDFSVYIPGAKEVSAREGLKTLEADFELMRGVEVRGRVTDKVTGKPVAAGVSYRPGRGNTHPGAAFFRMVGKACDGPQIGTFREMVPPGPGVFLVTVRPVNDEYRYTQVRLDPADKAKAGLDEFLLHGVNAYRVIDVPADAKSMTCDIQVDPGRSLTGTVLGPDGKPLTGAMVKGLTAVWPKPTTLKAATFTVLALEPREPRQLMFVHLKRKLAGKLTVRGDEKGVVTVQLEPWATLTGRILDEDGQPLAGVRIQLGFPHSTFFLPVTWWVPPQGEEVKTDRDGRFHAEGLTPGMKVRLSASTDKKYFQLAGTTELSVRAGETKDLGELKVKPD